MPSKPVVIINTKTYPQGTGERAVRLAEFCEAAARGFDIRIAVQATDIGAVAKAVRIPVYAQHCDPVAPGKTTGWITAKALKAAGAKGALLNHAERRIPTIEIVAAAKALRKERLAVIVCAESIARLHEIDGALSRAGTRADYLAVEPPELIGGDVSVSVAQPDVVIRAVQATRAPVLVGAGVRSHADLEIALEYGAAGVLLSKGIVTAPHQERALRRLLTAP